MEEIIELKRDLQQAIANNMKKFSANYDMLFFGEDNKEYLKNIIFFKSIKIKPNNANLLFEGELDNEMISRFTEDEMLRIKQISWNIQVEKIMEEQHEKSKTNFQKQLERIISERELQELIEDCKNNKNEYRDITESEKDCVISCKNEIKNILNIDMELIESEELLGLAKNLDEIDLNINQIDLLYNLANSFFDIFGIFPVYSEEDDSPIGVRLFLGIDLNANKE